MVLQSSKESGRVRCAGRDRTNETIISRFGHTGLNGTLYKTGKHNTGSVCEYCGQEETVEHVMLHCQKYESERRHLIQNLRKIEIHYDLKDILQKNSRNDYYQILFQFLGLINLI